MTTQTTIGVRLDSRTKMRLRSLGAKRERSPHYLVKKAIERYLELEEKKEKEIEIIKERWDKFSLTGKAVEHSKVKNWASKL